jgi:hypothetical protein
MGEFYDCFFNVVRKLKRKEPVRRIEIIFTLFVDHTKHAVFFGRGILEDFVDLTKV